MANEKVRARQQRQLARMRAGPYGVAIPPNCWASLAVCCVGVALQLAVVVVVAVAVAVVDVA